MISDDDGTKPPWKRPHVELKARATRSPTPPTRRDKGGKGKDKTSENWSREKAKRSTSYWSIHRGKGKGGYKGGGSKNATKGRGKAPWQ